MKAKKKTQIVKVNIPSGIITPEEAKLKAARLRTVVLESISEIDVRHIMTTMVGKAKNGDHQSAMTVLAMSGAIPSPAEGGKRVGNMVQVNVGDAAQQDEGEEG